MNRAAIIPWAVLLVGAACGPSTPPDAQTDPRVHPEPYDPVSATVAPAITILDEITSAGLRLGPPILPDMDIPTTYTVSAVGFEQRGQVGAYRRRGVRQMTYTPPIEVEDGEGCILGLTDKRVCLTLPSRKVVR